MMAYRYNRRYYGPGRGMGRGYSRGYGMGRRWYSPNCDWYPDRPRGWWAMQEYGPQRDGLEDIPPPAGGVWSPYSKPENLEDVNQEITLLESEIERLKKAIINLQSIKESLDED